MLKNKHTHCFSAAGNRDKTQPSAQARVEREKNKTFTGGFHGNCLLFGLGGGQARSRWVRPTFKVAHFQGGRELFKVDWNMSALVSSAAYIKGSREVTAVQSDSFERMIMENGDNWGVASFHLGLHSQHARLPGHTHSDTHILTGIIDIKIIKSAGNYIKAWGMLL